MSKTEFKFNSITYAIKGKNIAEKLGCKTKMIKNPNPQKGEGCGYRLEIYGNSERIINAFDENKIKYIGYETAK